MPRHDTLIVKETHRGLLYEDGVLREVLPAGRYRIPRPPSAMAAFFGIRGPLVEVVLVDVRGRDRTVVVQDLPTADGATISASFVVHYRVDDPRAATHRVKDFEERLCSDAQAAARRALRAMTLDEVLGGRDEIAEELHRLVRESAEGYGLEVSMLDFKDLVLPEEYRRALNRAAILKRLRQAQLLDEAIEAEIHPAAPEARAIEAEEPEAVLARMAFDGQGVAPEKGPGRHPRGPDSFGGVPRPPGSDGLRRLPGSRPL